MKMLRAKLVELQMQEKADKISDLKGVQLKIEWGSQIRSYSEYLYRPGRSWDDRLCLQFPGSIRAVEVMDDRPMVVQKAGFLAAEEGVELSIFFQKKTGAGFFGGEGFIMQKLSGRGTAFLEVDGYAVEYELKAGRRWWWTAETWL